MIDWQLWPFSRINSIVFVHFSLPDQFAIVIAEIVKADPSNRLRCLTVKIPCFVYVVVVDVWHYVRPN